MNKRVLATSLRLLLMIALAMPQILFAQTPNNADGGITPAAVLADDALVEASIPPGVTVVQTIDTAGFATPSSDPTGIVFIPSPNRLLLADSEIEEMPDYRGANLFYLSLAGSLILTATTTSFSDEPTGLAYNPANGYLYIADDVDNRIYEMQGPGPDGIYGTNDELTTSFRTDIGLGSFDLEGLEFATIGGVDHLFLVDGTTNTVYTMQPGPNNLFNGGGDDIITSFNSEIFGITSMEGIAYHAANNSLFVVGTPKVRLAEVSLAGELIRLLDTSAAGAETPAGLGFGPGANPNLFMTDRRIDNVNDGKVYEFALPAVTAGNQKPVTDAGPDQVINLPTQATTLAGAVTDDGVSGGLLTHKWTVVNSRSVTRTVTFVDNDNLNTAVTFPRAGTYVLRLTADDNELASIDLVTITINGPPVVDAGLDQTVALTTGASLNATITDDGLPLPGVITPTWSMVSGPGTVTFGDPNTADTTANFSVAGDYVLRLQANDGGAVVSDEVAITVTAGSLPNQAPVVSVEPKQTIALTQTATLSGTVSDDGLPAPANLTATWSKVSGPGAITFGDANALVTTATFDAPGDYVLQLSVTDGMLTGTATMTVSVASGSNLPPTVNAGANQLVAFTAGATLIGNIGDDGNPTGQTLVITWSQVSGPGTVTFATPNAANTSATFSLPGVYVLALSANDGDVTTEDLIQVTVNRAPTVDAGPAQTISSGASATLDGVVTDDGFPAPVALTATWSKVSGPGTVTFDNPNAIDTTATFSVGGAYTLRLTVSDGHLTTNDTVEITLAGGQPNSAPTVSAGSDLTTTLSTPTALSGTVTDDGLPLPATITVTWSKASGPGDVAYANVNAATTTATFSAMGVYVLRLTADDGELDTADTVRVVVLAQQLYLPVVVNNNE